MSDSYRNGAFALGLVVGGGIALNLFLWLDYRTQQGRDQPASGTSNASGNEIGAEWNRFIGTFVSPSDTLAQWIMAIFTIAAVILVWRTLFATQEMVRDTKQMAIDTREIGEAQTRAHCAIKLLRLVRNRHGHDEIHFTVVNVGQTPAIKVRVEMKTQYTTTDLRVITDRLPPRCKSFSIYPLGDIAFMGEANGHLLSRHISSKERGIVEISVTVKFRSIHDPNGSLGDYFVHSHGLVEVYPDTSEVDVFTTASDYGREKSPA